MYETFSLPSGRPRLSSDAFSEQAAGPAKQILRLLQEEFMVRFPAFPEVFGQLSPVPFPETGTAADPAESPQAPLGTDGSCLYYEPSLLCSEFLRSPSRLKHAYLHVHVHCLCLHMFRAENYEERKSFGAGSSKNLWDQACDLSAELMTRRLLGEERSSLTELLSREGREPLLERFPDRDRERPPESAGVSHLRPDSMDAAALLPLLRVSPALREAAAQCSCDTHRFWYGSAPGEKDESPEQARVSPGENAGQNHPATGRRSFLLRLGEPSEEPWLKQRRRLNAFLTNGSGRRNREAGQDAEDAALQKRDETDYRKFLHRFAIPREEPVLDTDSFDYIPYCYGLTYYKNMPFLEPLEYSEVNRLDELAIAVDTSGSCSGKIVRRFLEETWNILRQKENFFSRMRLHLIQCDSMIQEHRIFTSAEQWEAALPGLKILGLGNTDFRPVFDYLNTLIQKREIRHLRGLLYFTDGDGIYPRTRPPFDTAFVFLNRRLEKQKTPDWGIRLNLDLPDTFDT